VLVVPVTKVKSIVEFKFGTGSGNSNDLFIIEENVLFCGNIPAAISLEARRSQH